MYPTVCVFWLLLCFLFFIFLSLLFVSFKQKKADVVQISRHDPLDVLRGASLPRALHRLRHFDLRLGAPRNALACARGRNAKKFPRARGSLGAARRVFGTVFGPRSLVWTILGLVGLGAFSWLVREMQGIRNGVTPRKTIQLVVSCNRESPGSFPHSH